MRGGPQQIPRPPTGYVGTPPPWVGLERDVASLGLDDVTAAVRRYGPTERITPRRALAGKDAAVLIPLFGDPNGVTLILTRRAATMRLHRHEVAFPGGRRDPDDASFEATALREAHEEIGLHPSLVKPIGQLDRFVTGASNTLVHPIVGSLEMPPAADTLTANPAEVEHILTAPFTTLVDPDAWREEWWRFDDHWWPITFFEVPGDTIWGATASMIRQLLCVSIDIEDRRAGPQEHPPHDAVPYSGGLGSVSAR